MGAVTVPSNATAVSVTYGTGTPPNQVCLLQRTTATAYDANGDVTATIDGTGRVTASSYDALGDDVADYEGQMLAVTGSSGSVTFQNLAPTTRTGTTSTRKAAAWVPPAAGRTPTRPGWARAGAMRERWLERRPR